RRCLDSVVSVTPAGEVRTNVALCCIRRPVVPPPRACELAVAAAAALRIDLVGVDLLPVGAGEYVVIELNAAVEFTPEYAEEDVYAAAVAALLHASAGVEPEDEAATADLVL